MSKIGSPITGLVKRTSLGKLIGHIAGALDYWANENKHAAAGILNKQTFYLDTEHTYRHIKNVDMVPNLSPQNLVAIDIGKDFMFSHGYIENDFDVREWAAPEFLEKAAKELIEERWQKVTTTKLPEASELQASTHRLG